MKKIGRILHGLSCGLLVLSSAAFAAIQGWQLVSGDWRLFENQLTAFAQITVRMLLAMYCFALSLQGVLGRSCRYAAGVPVIALAAAPFVSNGLGWMLAVPAAGLLLCRMQHPGT